MISEDAKNKPSAVETNAPIERRGLLRFGSILTAFSGASAISAFGASSAQAGPGDKNPPMDYVPVAEKGAASGVATLDVESKLPTVQLPDLSATIGNNTALYRPEWAGAVGDGVTDDYAALYEAAATAATLGADLLLTADAYNLGTSFLTLPAKTRLVGKSRIINTINGRPVVIAQSDTTISGITLENRGTTSRFLLQIAKDAKNVNILNVSFPASANTTGIYANSTGIANILIQGCRFDGMRYGVLVNSAAADISSVSITRNTFTNISNDAVEINLPSGGSGTGERGAGTGFLIDHNIISVPDSAGDGHSGGFGIGVAGATGVTIDHNVILEARYEGIHVEDDARDVTITGNVITNILGGDAYAAIHVLPSCQNVVITANSIRNVSGVASVGAIVASYDGATAVHTSHMIISSNTIRDITGVGISVAAGPGGRYRVFGNDTKSTTSHGIKVSGTPRICTVHDNTVTDAGGYGVYLSTPLATNFGTTIRANTVTGAASGDCNGFPITAGFGTPMATRYASFTPSPQSTTATLDIPLFRLGTYAQGIVCITGRKVQAPNDKAQCVFSIRWDGIALIYGKLNNATLGGMTSGALRVMDGVLVWRTTVGAAGISVEGNAHFDGTLIETGATFAGVIDGAIPTLGAAATDDSTTRMLANNIRAALISWGIAQP